MTWLVLIELVLKAIGGVAGYLGDKQLLDAGKASAIKDGLQSTLDNMRKADAVKDEIRNNPDGSFARGVWDKYTRTDE